MGFVRAAAVRAAAVRAAAVHAAAVRAASAGYSRSRGFLDDTRAAAAITAVAVVVRSAVVIPDAARAIADVFVTVRAGGAVVVGGLLNARGYVVEAAEMYECKLRKARLKLKAPFYFYFLLSKFETWCFQARVELAPPHRGGRRRR